MEHSFVFDTHLGNVDVVHLVDLLAAVSRVSARMRGTDPDWFLDLHRQNSYNFAALRLLLLHPCPLLLSLAVLGHHGDFEFDFVGPDLVQDVQGSYQTLTDQNKMYKHAR